MNFGQYNLTNQMNIFLKIHDKMKQVEFEPIQVNKQAEVQLEV